MSPPRDLFLHENKLYFIILGASPAVIDDAEIYDPVVMRHARARTPNKLYITGRY